MLMRLFFANTDLPPLVIQKLSDLLGCFGGNIALPSIGFNIDPLIGSKCAS
jgi:hypothetical protein